MCIVSVLSCIFVRYVTHAQRRYGRCERIDVWMYGRLPSFNAKFGTTSINQTVYILISVISNPINIIFWGANHALQNCKTNSLFRAYKILPYIRCCRKKIKHACVFVCTHVQPGEPWNSSVSIQQTDAQSPSSNMALEVTSTTVWRRGYVLITSRASRQSSSVQSYLSTAVTRCDVLRPGTSCQRRSYHVHYIPSIPLPSSRHYSMTFDLSDTARTLNLYGLLQTYKHYIIVCMH